MQATCIYSCLPLLILAGDLPFIVTNIDYVDDKYRGYRIPNNYSAESREELNNIFCKKVIRVHNARLLDPPPTLESHGFELVKAPTTLNLLDNNVVKTEFYKECSAILKEVAGCRQTCCGSHEYRNGFGDRTHDDPQRAKKTPNGSGGAYAQGIHSDMSPMVEDAMIRVKQHFQFLNIWRSTDLNQNIVMMPLALCDMNSVSPDDVVFGDGIVTKQYTKHVDQKLVYNPSHRWYYFPNMTPEEILVFRQYDTRQELLNMRTVFHSAVPDPNTPVDAPMRSTIEVRMSALYGLDDDKPARAERYKKQISNIYPSGKVSTWFAGPIENYKPPPIASAKL